MLGTALLGKRATKVNTKLFRIDRFILTGRYLFDFHFRFVFFFCFFISQSVKKKPFTEVEIKGK